MLGPDESKKTRRGSGRPNNRGAAEAKSDPNRPGRPLCEFLGPVAVDRDTIVSLTFYCVFQNQLQARCAVWHLTDGPIVLSEAVHAI